MRRHQHWASLLLVGILAGAATAAPSLERGMAFAQAADPLNQALQDIAKYEALADKLAPGDVATANRYIGELRVAGNRLRSVRGSSAELQDAIHRFNALNQRIVAIAKMPAGPAASGAAPSTAAPASTLTSSDQARLSRLARAVESLAEDVNKAPFQNFLDAREVGKLRAAVANQRAEAEGFPQLPEVTRISGQIEANAARIDARVAEAQGKNASLGDADALLAAMDARIKAAPVPRPQEFKPDAEPAAYARRLVELQEAVAADKATLDRIEASGSKSQKIGSLRHWAVVERQRQIDEARNSATQKMDAQVERFLQVVRFQAGTDPNNEDHRVNRLLGPGKYAQTVGEFKSGLAAVAAAASFDAALQRAGGPDRAAQEKALDQALGEFEAKFRTALAASRMPKPGMTDEKYIAIAKQVLANPDYRNINPALRLVINGQSVTHHEKREAEIRPGSVTTTATIYDWQWDEFQVATAESVGDEIYVFYNTLKYFHKGAPTTPLDRWVLSGRFQGPRILAENVDK